MFASLRKCADEWTRDFEKFPAQNKHGERKSRTSKRRFLGLIIELPAQKTPYVHD